LVEEKVDLTLLDKCSQSCSKHKGELYDDVSINIHNTIDIQDDKKTIECNTKEQIRNCFMEIKNITFEKLNDLEFKNTIQVHDLVWQSGVPNYLGCRIPVHSNINVEFFRTHLKNYNDKIICELLEFGAPIGFEGKLDKDKCESRVLNHKGASDFSNDILNYLKKEASYGAIIGPFKNNPFVSELKISPLNTVTKRDSPERRVILDLSFPSGKSVNDHISKEFYLGEKVELSYPNVDDLVGIIKDKGPRCMLFKKDLKRAYRQIPVGPGNIHFIGFSWENCLFVDRVLPMGLRSSAQICQRITTAVCYMYFQMGFSAVNYLDDFGGAEILEHAQKAYECLGELLNSCGLEESKKKSVEPTNRMTFLGVTFDTVSMTLEVTPERVVEISLLVQSWLRKKKASLKELQSLLGKLHFISSCVRPGRVFVNRLLSWLRAAFPENSTGNHRVFRNIPNYVLKDLRWWERYLSKFNGISMMSIENWSAPDEMLSCDACLLGMGAISKNQFFHTIFPEFLRKKNPLIVLNY
jgi:hypothetical protein